MYQKNITGRLGNQMFQYASMLGIKHMCNLKQDIMLSFRKVYEKGFENDLKHFNVNYTEIPKIKLTLKQHIFLNISRVIEKIIDIRYKKSGFDNLDLKMRNIQEKNMKFLAKNGILRYTNGFYNYCKIKEMINKKNIYLIGLLESSKYFDDIKEIIQDEFTPRHDILKENIKLYSIIENSESVCISIRRGDFLNNRIKSLYYVCTPDYFYNGIKIIEQKIKNPKFIVFSDDIKWCKENMKFPKGTEFERGNDPVWEKLRLMYSCKHFIISNSTFSWWAQYLSRNKNKIVVAPKKWRNSGYTSDIEQKFWTKID